MLITQYSAGCWVFMQLCHLILASLLGWSSQVGQITCHIIRKSGLKKRLLCLPTGGRADALCNQGHHGAGRKCNLETFYRLLSKDNNWGRNLRVNLWLKIRIIIHFVPFWLSNIEILFLCFHHVFSFVSVLKKIFAPPQLHSAVLAATPSFFATSLNRPNKNFGFEFRNQRIIFQASLAFFWGEIGKVWSMNGAISLSVDRAQND